ncbi:hypothetical protein [Cellvibrio mixtus]|uniref:hypothetical protein n=1 Tax=Cellvibrio mixtus TaxID=39650 RepID=UPI000586CF74|nr:hypothetical protein [Cellvibrio mixtus]
MSTNVGTFLGDLDGGVFEEKLSHILSQVAGAVCDHGRKGKITLEFELKQIGNGHQVTVDHKVKYVRPTKRGSVQEDEQTSTPMHVGKGGAMSFFPENQIPMIGKKGEIPAQV